MKYLFISILVSLFTIHLHAQLDLRQGFLIVPTKFSIDGKVAYTGQVKNLMEQKSPKAFKEHKSGLRLKTIGSSLVAFSLVGSFVGLDVGRIGPASTNPLNLLFIAPAAAGIVLNIAGNGRLKRSVKTYNKEQYQDTGFYLKPTVTQNGVGMVLAF